MGRKDSKAKKQEELRERNKEKAMAKQEKLDAERKVEAEKLEQGRKRREQREEEQRIQREEERRIAKEKAEARLLELESALKEVEEMDLDSLRYYLASLLGSCDYSCGVQREKRDSLYLSFPFFAQSLPKEELEDVVTMDVQVSEYHDTIANELCEIQLRERISFQQMFEQLAVHNTAILLVDEKLQCTKTIYYNNLRNGYKLMAVDYCVIYPEAQVKQLYETYYKLVHDIAKVSLRMMGKQPSEEDLTDLSLATHKLHYLLHLLEMCHLPTDPIADIYKFRTTELPTVISVEILKQYRQARATTFLNDFEAKGIQLELLDQGEKQLRDTIYVDRLQGISLEIDLSSYSQNEWDEKVVESVVTDSLLTSRVEALTVQQCKLVEEKLSKQNMKLVDSRGKKTRRGYLSLDVTVSVKDREGNSFSSCVYEPFDASFFFNIGTTKLLLVVDDNLEVVDKIFWEAEAFSKEKNRELGFTIASMSQLEEHLQRMAIFLDAGFHHRQYELMYQMYHGKSCMGRNKERIAYDMTLYYNTLEFIQLIFLQYQWMRGSDGNNFNMDQKYNLPHPLTIPLCTLEFRYQVFEQFMISRLHNFDENQPKKIDISQFDSPFASGMRLDLIKKVMEFKKEYHELLLATCHSPSTDVTMMVNEGVEVEKMEWHWSLDSEPKGKERNRYFYIT